MATSASISKFCKDKITFYESITDFNTPATNDDVLLSLIPAWETVGGTTNVPLVTFNSANSGAGSDKVVLRNIHSPELANDAATKAYVDGLAVVGVSWKNTAIVASTANITTFPPTDGIATVSVIDGVTIADGNRVLVKDQTIASENGVYEVTTGTWTRSADVPVGASASGFAIWIDQGTENGDNGFVITTDSGSDVIGTDSIVWAKFSSAQGVDGANGDIQFNDSGGHGSASAGTLNWNNADSYLEVAGNASDETALQITLGDIDVTNGHLLMSTGALNGKVKFGSNFEIGNDNTNSMIKHHSSGSFLIQSTQATSSHIHKVGDSAGGSEIRFQNSSNQVMLSLSSDGKVTQDFGTSHLLDSVSLNLGTGDDMTIVHDGTDASVTNTTGSFSITQSSNGSDLILENTTQDDMSFKLGANTTSNSFNFVGDSQGTPSTLVQIVANEEASTSLTTGTIRVTGGGAFTGEVSAMCFNSLSDATTKTNINPLSDPLKMVRQIEGYNYNFLPGYGQEGKLNTGVLAQQLETIPGLAHCVTTDPVSGIKSVNYLFLIPMLTGSTKTLDVRTELMSLQIKQLTSQVEQLLKKFT